MGLAFNMTTGEGHAFLSFLLSESSVLTTCESIAQLAPSPHSVSVPFADRSLFTRRVCSCYIQAFILTENDVLGQRVRELFFFVNLKCVSLGWLRCFDELRTG